MNGFYFFSLSTNRTYLFKFIDSYYLFHWFMQMMWIQHFFNMQTPSSEANTILRVLVVLCLFCGLLFLLFCLLLFYCFAILECFVNEPNSAYANTPLLNKRWRSTVCWSFWRIQFPWRNASNRLEMYWNCLFIHMPAILFESRQYWKNNLLFSFKL